MPPTCTVNCVCVWWQLMHDAEMSNTQSLTLGRSPRHRTVDVSARYATAPRHSSADSRISPYRLMGETGNTAQSIRSAGRSPRSPSFESFCVILWPNSRFMTTSPVVYFHFWLLSSYFHNPCMWCRLVGTFVILLLCPTSALLLFL